MTWTCRLTTCALLLSSLAASGCRAMTTPQQIAGLLERSSPVATYSVTCDYGERDWDYICHQHEVPTALGVSRGHKVEDRRQGVHLEASAGISFLFGKPGFTMDYLPNDGPIPSRDEWDAQKQKMNAARR
jgi:hypothetical protein